MYTKPMVVTPQKHSPCTLPTHRPENLLSLTPGHTFSGCLDNALTESDTFKCMLGVYTGAVRLKHLFQGHTRRPPPPGT